MAIQEQEVEGAPAADPSAELSTAEACFSALDVRFMRLALAEAQAALEAGEVPVGAVLVAPAAAILAAGRDPASLPLELEAGPPGLWLLGRGSNRTRREKRANAHAELIALERAGALLGDFRLEGATVYVTLEPCLMCLGALQQARISRVVFGAREPKFGALGSRFDLAGHEAMRRISFESGLLAAEASALMSFFFSRLRGAGSPSVEGG